MAERDNRSLFFQILLVLLTAGGTAPWWWEPVKNILINIKPQTKYVLQNDGVLLHNGLLFESNVAAFQAMNDSHVFILGTDNKLWLEQSKMDHGHLWEENVKEFRAINASTVYVLGTDNKLWLEQKSKDHSNYIGEASKISDLIPEISLKEHADRASCKPNDQLNADGGTQTSIEQHENPGDLELAEVARVFPRRLIGR